MFRVISFVVFFVFPFLGGCLTASRLYRYPERPQAYGSVQTLAHRGWNPYYFLNRYYARGYAVGPGAWDIIELKAWGTTYMISIPEIDLGLSLVADTILLPITIPAEIFSSRKMRSMRTSDHPPVYPPYWIGSRSDKESNEIK